MHTPAKQDSASALVEGDKRVPLKRAILTLVDKRQHTLHHLQKVTSEQGGFWFNTVHLTKSDFTQYATHKDQLQDA